MMGKSQDMGNIGISNTEPSEGTENTSSPPPTILKADPLPVITGRRLGRL